MDVAAFWQFWLDLGRISMDPWTLQISRILVGSGKDFHGSVDFKGNIIFFKLDLGRISMDS